MPVLTAQPTAEERQREPHHLVGCIPPAESFDAQRYADLARPILADIVARGKRALVVGGTGLYFRALISGFAPTPPPNLTRRTELDALELPELVEILRRTDPAAPALVDLQNRRRVVRAIEIVEGSGRPLADFRQTPPASAPGWLLVRERDELRQRIAQNVQAMFSNGVVEEVRSLGDTVGPTASRAIGWREIQALLRGELTHPEAEAAIITATQQYAKRQLTWFRHQTTFRSLDLTANRHPSDAVPGALRALNEPDAS